MKGKYFIIIGGTLLALFGGVFLYIGIDMILALENWKTSNISNYIIILLSFFLALTGIISILTVVFNSLRLLFFSKDIGIKLVTAAVIFQGADALSRSSLLVPFYTKFGLLLNLDLVIHNIFNLASVMVLSLCIHILLTGIEAAVENWNAFMITRSITRLLYIVAIGVLFYFSFYYTVKWNLVGVYHMGIFSSAACFLLFILIFIFMRYLNYYDIVRLCISTFICILIHALFIYLIFRFGKIVNIVVNILLFLIPIGFIFGKLGLYSNSSTASNSGPNNDDFYRRRAEENRRHEENNRRAQEESMRNSPQFRSNLHD